MLSVALNDVVLDIVISDIDDVYFMKGVISLNYLLESLNSKMENLVYFNTVYVY